MANLNDRGRWGRWWMLPLLGALLVAALSHAFAADRATLDQLDKRFLLRDDVQQLRLLAADTDKLQAGSPADYDLAWRAAEFKYYLSEALPDKNQRVQILKQSVELAKKAVALDSSRPEGHFWLASANGSLAELQGPFSSLWKIGAIRKGFETVLKLNPAYNNGSAYLALGEMFIQLPGLLGGSESKGIELLETGLKISVSNHDLKYSLAEAYLKKNRKKEAHQLLEKILTTDDPLLTPKELAQIRAKSSKLMAQAS